MYYAKNEERHGPELYGFRSARDRADWLEQQTYAQPLDYKEARAFSRARWQVDHPDTGAVVMTPVDDWYLTFDKFGEFIVEFECTNAPNVSVAIYGNKIEEVNELAPISGPVLLPLRQMGAIVSEIRAPWADLEELRGDGLAYGLGTITECIRMHQTRDFPQAPFGFAEDMRHIIAVTYRAIVKDYGYVYNDPDAGNNIEPGVIRSIKAYDVVDDIKEHAEALA